MPSMSSRSATRSTWCRRTGHRSTCSSSDVQRLSEDCKVIIAGAGGAAHLPGMLASATALPVIGVPVPLARLDGMDSLLSIVQMPAGVPVATVAIGNARNAGLLAVRILGAADAELRAKMVAFQERMAEESSAKGEALRRRRAGQVGFSS